MNPVWRDVLERAGRGGLLLGGLVVALGVAWLVPERPEVALALAGVVLVGVAALVHPATLPLLAMPLVVVVLRVGGGGIDLTVSDAVLALAFWPAVLLAPRPFSPQLRSLLWLNAVYQALTLFTVIANPFLANTVEWFHAWLLVSGALIVGWAVGASGHARLGLSLFLLACLGLALATVVQGLLQYAGGNFGAVYPTVPWSMHKNFIGTLLGFAAVVAYARPSWMGWSRRLAMWTFWVLVAAILVSQSRQALVGLVVALLIVSFRGHGERRRSVLALLGVLPVLALVATIARDQIAEGNQHNSFFQRLDWYQESYVVWLEQPVTGYGLRYWTQAGAPTGYQPPNIVLEVAATTGLLGLLGLVIWLVGTVVVLWRADPAYGTLALALLATRLAQGQFDLFWISIGVSVPFLLVGVCLGADAARDRSVSPPRPAGRVGVPA